MQTTVIKNAYVVNESHTTLCDVRIRHQRIDKIDRHIADRPGEIVIDAQGRYLLPGMIDDQVHFREPGLTDKGTITSESRAAVAGGITSYMEMPNVSPTTTNIETLQAKFDIAARHSLANYSFYLGATHDNLEQIKRLDSSQVCGVKVFMGASTGNLLVEDPHCLESIFRESPVLIATHCEDNQTIQQQQRQLREQLSPELWQPHHHPLLRDDQACYRSSSLAVGLAKRYHSQLHVLHTTSAKELALFEPGPIDNKQITAEACVHHLWFSDRDYAQLGNQIKCNPAIKTNQDRMALLDALQTGVIDIIATDHAPHTWEEKMQPYVDAPAGLPLVQHAMLSLLQQVTRGTMALPLMVEKISHNPAKRYQIKERGFIREGYYADLVLVDLNAATQVTPESLHYLCRWSPFSGHTFPARICATFVNGALVYDGEQFSSDSSSAMALQFQRKETH